MSSNISLFTYGPLSELIGNDVCHSGRLAQGLTEEQMDEIVNYYGHLAPALKEALKRVVHRKDKDGKSVVFNWTFTGEDYKKAFRKGRYNTAPGYSGISMIHLRTIAQDPELATIYAKILELPFRYGFAYKHWLKSVQTLLQKEALPYVHRMRILKLVSFYFNGILKYLKICHWTTLC